MTSKKELEAMVTQFKVTDLQSLLNFAGQNNKGRKSDLQRKVLNLIRHNISMPIEVKIRTMYRQILNETQKNNYYCETNNYDRYNYYSNNSSYPVPPATSGMSYDPYNSKNYYQNQNGNNMYYEECMRKNNHLYTPVVHRPTQNHESSASSVLFDYMSYLETGTNIPEAKSLKDFKFKKLSFYRYDQTIIPLMPIKPQHKFSDVFDYTHSFTVSDQAYNLLTWPKKNEKESRFQLQLRICVLDQASMSNPSNIADSLPLALAVKVNDKNCQLPSAIPSTNKQGMLLRRMNAPINITCQSSKKNQLNTLAINWSVECNKLYGFTVHLVEKYTSDELIENLKITKHRGPELTRKYIHDKLDYDDDIATTSLKVSLICPLGKILMSLPARATTCNHIQCFDATLYLKMNEVKSVWQCPICNSSCFYEDLFIDGYFVDILSSEQFSSDVREVQINDDGSWEPIGVKKRKNSDSEITDHKKKRSRNEELDESENELVAGVPSKDTSKKETCALQVPSTQEVLEHPIYRTNGVTLISITTPKESENSDSLSNSCCTIDSVSSDVSDDQNNQETLETSKTIENTDPCKMNDVVLVDLTSDSELEESSSPLNLKISEVNNPHSDEPSSSVSVPPLYDLDDSDELS